VTTDANPSTPEEPDLADDPMMRTLTDALRAGPGSPEWRRAVDAVAESRPGSSPGSSDAEYRILITARERLESGKSYREVRPGPGFTRTVMARIDADESARKPRRLRASFLAYIVVTLIVGVVVLIVMHAITGGVNGNVPDLKTIDLARTVLAAKLDGPLPAGWRTFGTLPVDPTRGLQPGNPPAGTGRDYAGGGIVTDRSLPTDQVFAIAATFHFQHVDSDIVPQLFVTDQPDFGPGPATSPHELVWLVQDGLSQISLPGPDAKMSHESARVSDGQTLEVRIVIGETDAAVFVNQKLFWTGPHQLAGTQRFAGVRLIRHLAKGQSNAVTVSGVKVLEK
jgi:hypothetical protein